MDKHQILRRLRDTLRVGTPHVIGYGEQSQGESGLETLRQAFQDY